MLAFITFNEANYLKEKKLEGGGHDHEGLAGAAGV